MEGNDPRGRERQSSIDPPPEARKTQAHPETGAHDSDQTRVPEPPTSGDHPETGAYESDQTRAPEPLTSGDHPETGAYESDQTRVPEPPTSGDHPGAKPRESDQTGPDEDALRRLEQRLDRASDAAERLIAEAAASATRKPPPAGWQTPSDQGEGQAGDRRWPGDLELLAQALHALRDLIPPELQRRIAEALRELLLALRALIDWYLQRSERHRPQPAEVQDIPIL
jgi:hypothetical protein